MSLCVKNYDDGQSDLWTQIQSERLSISHEYRPISNAQSVLSLVSEKLSHNFEK